MRFILFSLLITAFLSCTNHPQERKNINDKFFTKTGSLQKNKNYDSAKIEIVNTKLTLYTNWKTLSGKEKSEEFINAVVKKIIPFWYGTKWNFNGTTKIPNEGTIACGYFVTTVLQDAGLNISRCRLAQCSSEQMIRELTNKKFIHRFRNADMDIFLKEMKTEGPGLFIIGLDNHTGFIYNDGDKIYFIHSCFINAEGVKKEVADNSIILAYSKYKITGKISDDEQMLNKWILRN